MIKSNKNIKLIIVLNIFCFLERKRYIIMIELKSILLNGVKTSLKKVHIQIDAGYVIGDGWTVDSTPFDSEISTLFAYNDWNLHFPKKYSGGCIKAYKNGQYLYLHPMGFDGYIDPKNEAEITSMLKDASTFKLNQVHYSDDVYDIDDSNMISLYNEHLEEINKIILLFFKDKRNFRDIFDILYKDSKIIRNGEFYMSSCDVQYRTLELIVRTLITNGLIRKYKDGRYATVKRYLPIEEKVK